MMSTNRWQLAAAVAGILLGALLLAGAGQGTAAAAVSAAPRLISAADAGQAGNIVYTVRRGDTLYSIARRYRISALTLMRINQLSNPNRIYIGQRLLIPVAGPTPAPTRISSARWRWPGRTATSNGSKGGSTARSSGRRAGATASAMTRCSSPGTMTSPSARWTPPPSTR